MTTSAPQVPLCAVPSCGARVHGRGLCRTHYDERRHLESTGRSPELEAEAERERAIRTELEYGSVIEWRSPHGTTSIVHLGKGAREAWEARRDDLLESSPPVPGMRPAAWWRFEARRPQHLTPSPVLREGTVEERRLAWDDYEIEPLVFLAENGHLKDAEVDAIREHALEVAGRIGTGHEHWGSGGVDYPDRRAVKLAVAVDKALGRASEDYAGVDVDTFSGGWAH